MKYITRGESRVANIAACYICHLPLLVLYLSRDPHQELYTFIQTKSSALSVLLYFKLKDLLTEDIPLKFNTFNE